jgi:hypothetical protein
MPFWEFFLEPGHLLGILIFNAIFDPKNRRCGSVTGRGRVRNGWDGLILKPGRS